MTRCSNCDHNKFGVCGIWGKRVEGDTHACRYHPEEAERHKAVQQMLKETDKEDDEFLAQRLREMEWQS
jgi:hypothetical protein